MEATTLRHIVHASASRWLLLPLLLAVVSGCAASSGPARLEVEDDGFTITEDVRAGYGVRSAFDDAVASLKQRNYGEGIVLLLDVTEAAPTSAAAHIDLGIAYREVDELDRARVSLERALELNPRHPVAYNELGIVYRRTGRFEDARKSYEKALDVHAEFHFARRNLAILCDMYLRDLECALENYRIYSRAVPDDESAAMWIDDLQNRLGE